MGCICSTRRSQGSSVRSQFDSTNGNTPSGRADVQSSPERNLSALASLLDATYRLNHQLDADRSVIGEVLTPLQQANHKLREEIAERIHAGSWNSPPNALQDCLNTIRRDFNAIIAIDGGQGLHYSGEFPTISASSSPEITRSEISLSGSLPDTP